MINYHVIVLAFVANAPGEPLVMQQILVQPPQKMEVRIKILYTSICHTDLSGWKGEVSTIKHDRKTLIYIYIYMQYITCLIDSYYSGCFLLHLFSSIKVRTSTCFSSDFWPWSFRVWIFSHEFPFISETHNCGVIYLNCSMKIITGSNQINFKVQTLR